MISLKKSKRYKMLNIIIPMAGLGTRFVNAGYSKPKPLIEVKGQTMISMVIKNLTPSEEHKFIFICQKDHIRKTKLKDEIKNLTTNYRVIEVDNLTEGPASSVLLAEKYIDNNNPLKIANCDQFIDIDINQYLKKSKSYDGFIMTMWANDPKWSFVKLGSDGLVKNVREKVPISDLATVGIYMFSKGKDFVDAAIDMIIHNERVNNEFYVCPVYNYAIKNGKKIGIFDIPNHHMHGLGTPEDLKKYTNLMAK